MNIFWDRGGEDASTINQTFFPYAEGRIEGKSADRINGQSRNKRSYSGTGVERMEESLTRPSYTLTLRAGLQGRVRVG